MRKRVKKWSPKTDQKTVSKFEVNFDSFKTKIKLESAKKTVKKEINLPSSIDEKRMFKKVSEFL